MQRKRVSWALVAGSSALAVALAVIAGCNPMTSGDGIGTPLGENLTVAGQPGGRVALMLQGTRPATPLASARSLAPRAVTPVDLTVTGADGTAQGTISLTDARISLKEFKFKRPESDLDQAGDDVENEDIKLEGPFVVDLLTDTVTPEIPPVDLVAGQYTEIQTKINVVDADPEDEDATGTPLVDPADPMFGYSIYLAGTYTGSLAGSQVTSVPFVLAFDLDEEVTIAASDPTLGFEVNFDMLQTVIVAFRIAQWFDFSDTEANPDGFDFGTLTGTGAIALDASADGVAALEGVRDVIKKKIEASADTGRDTNDDGRLDSTEDDDPPALDAEDGTGADGTDA